MGEYRITPSSSLYPCPTPWCYLRALQGSTHGSMRGGEKKSIVDRASSDWWLIPKIPLRGFLSPHTHFSRLYVFLDIYVCNCLRQPVTIGYIVDLTLDADGYFLLTIYIVFVDFMILGNWCEKFELERTTDIRGWRDMCWSFHASLLDTTLFLRVELGADSKY